jgi:hypothetical protein
MKTNRNTYQIGRSVRTVKRILAEEKNTGTLRPPKVPQREDLLISAEHQKYLIRRTVHQFFFDNLPPTLNLIHAKIQQNEEIPKLTRSKLLLLLLLLFGMLVNRLYTQTKTNSKQRYTMQQLKKRLCTRYGKRSIKPLNQSLKLSKTNHKNIALTTVAIE